MKIVIFHKHTTRTLIECGKVISVTPPSHHYVSVGRYFQSSLRGDWAEFFEDDKSGVLLYSSLFCFL